MKITVTQKHINVGEPRRAYCCPVALALWEATGYRFSIGTSTACRRVAIASQIILPDSARHFISDFDGGKLAIEPFSFEFDFTPETPTLTKPEQTEPYGISEHDLG